LGEDLRIAAEQLVDHEPYSEAEFARRRNLGGAIALAGVVVWGCGMVYSMTADLGAFIFVLAGSPLIAAAVLFLVDAFCEIGPTNDPLAHQLSVRDHAELEALARAYPLIADCAARWLAKSGVLLRQRDFAIAVQYADVARRHVAIQASLANLRRIDGHQD